MQTKSSMNNSGLGHYWKRLPVFVRAILLGFTICFGGITCWTVGFALIPLPYTLVYVLLFLALYIVFFMGMAGPKKSLVFRKTNFRAVHLSRATWIRGIAGSLLFVIIVQASLVITFRLVPFPEQAFKSQYPVFDTLPRVLAWTLVIASALVAGVCEETGFRGYLQVPMEKKYGALLGISFSSLLFMLVHLSKAWAGGIVPQIFLAGVLLGILAYKTGSLVPGIIAHVLLDIINFSYWWSHLAGNFTQKTISQTGVDSGFVFWSLLFIGSVVAFFEVTAKLKPQPENRQLLEQTSEQMGPLSIQPEA
jgi:membrane protease YdiL (CAAX protease family)